MDSKSMDFKMKDGRTIKFTVTNESIISECGPFKAKYKHTEVNEMLELHDKILTPAQLKKIRIFINESREPEQLNLF